MIMTEKIKCAAYRWKGVVYEGRTHADVAFSGPSELVEFGEDRRHTKNLHYLGEAGFVTTTGRFVDRRNAAGIAISSGQIKRLRFLPDGELDSSDINEPDNGEKAHYNTPEYLLRLVLRTKNILPWDIRRDRYANTKS